MFFEERVAELMRKMLRKKLYVVLSKPAVEPRGSSRSSWRTSNT